MNDHHSLHKRTLKNTVYHETLGGTFAVNTSRTAEEITSGTFPALWKHIVDSLPNALYRYAFLSPSSSATLSPNYTEWSVRSPFSQTNRWYSSEKVESYVTFSSVGRTTKVNTADLLFNFSWPLGHKSNKNKKLALVKHRNNRKKS